MTRTDGKHKNEAVNFPALHKGVPCRMKRFGFVVAALLSFCLVSSVSADGVVFIVRHAEKASNDEKDPDISEAGRARAQKLAAIVKEAGIEAIYVSEFKRTQQTAEPLARQLKVKPEAIPAGDQATLLEKLKSAKGSSLVVGHGNTIPDLIKALGLTDQVQINESDYDNLFIVVRDGPPRLIRLHL